MMPQLNQTTVVPASLFIKMQMGKTKMLNTKDAYITYKIPAANPYKAEITI